MDRKKKKHKQQQQQQHRPRHQQPNILMLFSVIMNTRWVRGKWTGDRSISGKCHTNTPNIQNTDVQRTHTDTNTMNTLHTPVLFVQSIVHVRCDCSHYITYEAVYTVYSDRWKLSTVFLDHRRHTGNWHRQSFVVCVTLVHEHLNDDKRIRERETESGYGHVNVIRQQSWANIGLN